MARKRSRSRGEAAKLEMTPMIDVVFQLLIFFIVTLKQEDILSHLDVSRPAPSDSKPIEIEEDTLLTILVFREGYIVQGRRLSYKALDHRLRKMAKFNRNAPVVIKCTGDSPHGRLVVLLDLCAKSRLENLSVFSM